jgi:hypothetical protein
MEGGKIASASSSEAVLLGTAMSDDGSAVCGRVTTVRSVA